MNCRNLIRELSEYLDGNLETSVARELERHLERCEDCRLVVNTTRKTIEIFCKSDPLPLPPDVQDGLRRALSIRLARIS